MTCPACNDEVKYLEEGCPRCIGMAAKNSGVGKSAERDSSSMLLLLLSFIMPPGGLLFYFLNWQRCPRLASSVAISSLSGGGVAVLSLLTYGVLR